MVHQNRGWLLFAAVFFLFSGSGGEWEACAASQKKVAQLIEPCQLITKAEAGEIMGTEMKAGQYSENKVVGQKMCLYEEANENSFAFLQISLTQNAFIPPKIFASGQTAQTIFGTIKEAFPNREAISETGDDAFIAIPGIHILYVDYYMSLAAGNINQNRDKLTIAGAKAMANLEAALK